MGLELVPPEKPGSSLAQGPDCPAQSRRGAAVPAPTTAVWFPDDRWEPLLLFLRLRWSANLFEVPQAETLIQQARPNYQTIMSANP